MILPSAIWVRDADLLRAKAELHAQLTQSASPDYGAAVRYVFGSPMLTPPQRGLFEFQGKLTRVEIGNDYVKTFPVVFDGRYTWTWSRAVDYQVRIQVKGRLRGGSL